MNKAVEQLTKGRTGVFKGNYVGVNPRNPAETIDLNEGYIENEHSSNPSFGYVLKDCIIIEN